MADKITSYGSTGVDLTSTRSRGPVRNERAADGDKAEAGSRTTDSSSTSSQVRLTDSAANLQQIETRIADLPDVDRTRVDTLRRRVESGAYQVNAGRLADRLLAFERDLA
jgi:negative regulator of flagellin synthesis FlgM